MLIDDYLRDQATKYRELAEQVQELLVRQELLELAAVCDEVADNIEDGQSGGRGRGSARAGSVRGSGTLSCGKPGSPEAVV